MLLETSFGFQMWTLVQEGLDFYQSYVVNRAEKRKCALFLGSVAGGLGVNMLNNRVLCRGADSFHTF